MIIDVHSHAWSYPQYFAEGFRAQARRARSGAEIDLSVTYEAYRAQATSDVRTIVFGGKARLGGLWVDDQYVADDPSRQPATAGAACAMNE